MNREQIGALLRRLRMEQGLTQKELAETLNVSDKAISKWERGVGLPDISMLADLSAVFRVEIANLLTGDLNEKEQDGGNMKRLQFYVCPHCGNILTASTGGELSCCGRSLSPLVAQTPDEEHTLRVEVIEQDYYITFSHPMSKQHYLSFVAWADDHRLLLIRLYPEQGGELRFPQLRGGRLYYYCSSHGLWVKPL